MPNNIDTRARAFLSAVQRAVADQQMTPDAAAEVTGHMSDLMQAFVADSARVSAAAEKAITSAEESNRMLKRAVKKVQDLRKQVEKSAQDRVVLVSREAAIVAMLKSN